MPFTSRSGPIRSKIALAKKRINSKCQAAVAHSKQVMDGATTDEIRKFIDLLEGDIVTIKRSIDEILKYDESWTNLIAELNSDDATEEEAIYTTTATAAQGYLTLNDAADALIESHDRLIREYKSKLALSTSVLTPTVPAAAGANDLESSILKLVNTIQNTSKAHLPTLNIPVFDGSNIEEYTGWWQRYETNVHKKNLTDAEKMSFLLSYLRGDALQCVKSYPINDSNYQKVVDKLKANYGNERDIKVALIDKLRNAPEIVDDVKIVRQEIERCEAWIRQLEELKEPVDTLDIERAIEARLPDWLLLKTTEAKLDDSTWNATKLREKVLRQLTVYEETNRVKELNKGHAQKSSSTKKKSNPPISTSTSSNTTVTATHAKQPPRKNDKKQTSVKQHACLFCDGAHKSSECHVYATDDQRKDVLRQKKRCFVCLASGHSSTNCTKQEFLRCFCCKGKHNIVWCPKKKSQSVNVAHIEEISKDRTISAAVAAKDEAVCAVKADLKTLTAMKEAGAGLLLSRKCTIANPEDMSQQIKALVLFDCGATASFMKANFARKLQLKAADKTLLNVDTFGAAGHIQVPSEVFNISLHLTDNSTMNIKVKSTPTILNSIWAPQTDPTTLEDVVNLRFCQDEPIILVGIDYFFKLIKLSNTYSDEGFTWVESLVGPMICGKGILPKEAAADVALPLVATSEDDRFPFITPDICSEVAELANKNADEIIAKALWEVETIGIRDPLLLDEFERAQKIFNDTVYLENNRYVVSWLKHDISDLPIALNLCIARLKLLVPELKKNGYLQQYDDIINEQVTNQVQEDVPEDEIETTECHYNPHFLVTTPAKTTTKLRVVYDASAAARGKKSLNDCLLNGKPKYPKIASLLTYARWWPILVASDIEKAFLQLKLAPKDRDLVRSVWLKNINKPVTKENLRHLRFLSMTFGVNCSPILLLLVLIHHLEQLKLQYPELAELIQEIIDYLYVDNLEQGSSTPAEAIFKAEKAREFLQLIEMNLRMFQSNSSIVNEHFGNTEKVIKLLGVTWNLVEDMFCIGWPNIEKCPTTKRGLLAFQASLFDPLQLLQPCVIPVKLAVQSLWEKKLKWNAVLDKDTQEVVNELYDQLNDKQLVIPRILFNDDPGLTYELHIFGDSSGYAYGVAAYLIKVTENARHATLVMAKGRLLPLNNVGFSIARKELLAATLAGEFLPYLMDVFPVKPELAIIWTDSTTVLHWWRNSESKDRFINNRIIKLKALDVPLRYVPTADNPADKISRGCTIYELKDSHLWWHGPKFLTQEADTWPVEPATVHHEEDVETAAPVDIVIVQPTPATVILDTTRFSTWKSLINCLSIMLRYLAKKFPKFRIAENLPGTFFQSAEWIIICEAKVIQMIQSSKTLTQRRMNELNLFIDDDKFIRKETRLDKTAFNFDVACPLYLNDCYEARLLIMHIHDKLGHSGVATVVAELRQKFYLPKAVQVVKKVIHRCNECKRDKAKPFSLPPMPTLPVERTLESLPFVNCGVDYAGPYNIRINGILQKAWICLFTCMSTRNIHLEIVFSASAKDFIMALRRFSARRSRSNLLISDNGGNFKATASIIPQKWFVEADPELMQYCSSEKIIWKFIVERAPWNGGFYERMIGLMKTSLKRTLGRKQPDLEIFRTLLTEVEAIVNSRPLVQITSDEQPFVLRPIDFILPFGKPGVPFCTDNETDDPPYVPKDTTVTQLEKFWNQLNERISTFQTIFRNEYLLALRDRMNKLHPKPWSAVSRRPEGNELVIIEDEDVPKSDWKMARIVETHLGDDGECRSATVKTANGRELKRSVKHLYPLELSTSLLIICLISCMFSFAAASKCPNNIIDYDTVFHENCLKTGYVIMKSKLNNYCWKKLQCEDDSHIIRSATHAHDDDAYCGGTCKCPDWATTCSFYLHPFFANSTTSHPATRQLIEHNQPSYCSLNPSPRCSQEKSEKLFYQIELFDGTLHYVNTLTFIGTQIHENSIKCYGEGVVSGTPEYCQHHECHENGTQLCTIQSHEILMWLGGEGRVEIKAYGLIKAFVFDYPKAQPVQQMKVACNNGTLKVDNLIAHDRIQIKFRNDQVVFLVNETSFSYELPDVYAVKTQNVEIYRINLGRVVDTQSITCQNVDICQRIKCSFCLISLLNPQCTSGITLVVFSCIVGFVCGVLTYPVGRCCRRRYLRNRAAPLNYAKKYDIEENVYDDKATVIDIGDEPITASTAFTFSRDAIMKPIIRNAPVLMCLIGLLCLLQAVEGATKVQVFSAESISCDVTSSGWKTCHFDETTIITMKTNDVAELLLKDDVGRPQQTIRIEAEPVAICKRMSKGFTRISKIDVASMKRCPGRGSCVSNYCASLPVTANVSELAVAHQYPGNSFCSEACGGWGCGCPSFDAACLFYKIVAIPITEEPIEQFTCIEWMKEIRLTIQQVHSKEVMTHKFNVKEGETITVNRLKIGVKFISTPITSIASLKFVTDGTRIAMLDDITQAAMGLVYCHTKADAVKLNCTVAMDICSCQPGETKMNCACRENQMIQSLLEHRALPQEKLNVLIVENSGALYYPLLDSTVELQVTAEQLKAVTQIDLNKCTLDDVKLEGCANCINGAQITGKCSTDFGFALAQVKCDNDWEFSFRCSNPGTAFTAIVHADSSKIDTKCNLTCPSNFLSFEIQGKLAIVEQLQREVIQISHEMIQTPGFIDTMIEYIANAIYSSYVTIITAVVVIVIMIILIRCL